MPVHNAEILFIRKPYITCSRWGVWFFVLLGKFSALSYRAVGRVCASNVKTNIRPKEQFDKNMQKT